MGSIPAEALPFLIFYASYLFSFTFVVWSRGAMETRLPPKQKIVGSTPTGIVFYVDAFYYGFFSFCSFLFLIFLILIFLCSYLLFFFLYYFFFSVLPYFSFLFLCCESKSGRVVQGGSLRYCSLRRRGFEPHLLHFSFFYSPFPYILLSGYFLFLIYGWPLSIVGSAFP